MQGKDGERFVACTRRLIEFMIGSLSVGPDLLVRTIDLALGHNPGLTAINTYLSLRSVQSPPDGGKLGA